MAVNKKEFSLGALLMVGFLVVLVGLFMPLFDGHNAMEYMDNLYNSISKASANYMDQASNTVRSLGDEQIDAILDLKDETVATRTAQLFNEAGATAIVRDQKVSVQGDLGEIFTAAVDDARLLYANNGAAIESQYGYNARAALYNWWNAAAAFEKTLNKASRFDAAQQIREIRTKALETAYNYYGVESKSIGDSIGIVIGSLVFYVVYTLWYDFAILFMFEGAGFRLEH